MTVSRDYDKTERAWLWLNDLVGANVSAAEQLLYNNEGLMAFFDSARSGSAIRLPDRFTPAQRKAVCQRASDGYIDGLIEKLGKAGIFAVTRGSEDYPSLLREIYDPPTVLFVKGRMISYPKLPIAVIGSRKCTAYGREMAAYFGRKLAEKGACVVSGLALGCDSIAAENASQVLSNDYPTVAVLGSGPDVVYPHQSAKLYETICERGAVISEFKPGTRPSRENFPRRNRIISGLSKGVLIIEAAVKSGTRITAECALEQGRDVFAIPGRINDLMSVGTNGLIKSGEAKCVFDVDDILYEYGIFDVPDETPIKKADVSSLPPQQRDVYEALMSGEKSVDEICMITGYSVSEVNMYLTELELSEIIKQLPNGEYGI